MHWQWWLPSASRMSLIGQAHAFVQPNVSHLIPASIVGLTCPQKSQQWGVKASVKVRSLQCALYLVM